MPTRAYPSAILILLISASAGGLHAQAMHSGHQMAAQADTILTPAARLQLETARRAAAAYATPEAARAAGYRAIFGEIPLQGEHFVRADLVSKDSFDLEHPSVLMFAPIDGKETLIGVAYAFLHPTNAVPPAGFDGADEVWHTHDRLLDVPGKHLVMMHTWFVASPLGPFARFNPALAYLAAGLAPPSAAALADSANAERVYRLGMSLALVTEPPLLLQLADMRGGDSLRMKVDPHRQALLALIPRLKEAQRRADTASYERLASEGIVEGAQLVGAYRDAAGKFPRAQRVIDRVVDAYMGRDIEMAREPARPD
jgi:hypothetical protein